MRTAVLLATLFLLPTLTPAAADKPSDDALAAGLAKAAELGRENPQFAATLQPLAPAFQPVDVNTTPGQAKWQKVTLNRLGKRVDAIRFRTPALADPKAKPVDMTWAFAFPADSVDVWYIAPVVGTMQGFQNFFRPKRETLANVGDVPADYRVIAQRLPAKNLKPDTEYILWFTFANDKPADLHVAINFVPTKGATEKATLDALNLTAPPK